MIMLGLLALDYFILAISQPQDFCMMGMAQGQAQHRRMHKVYAYIGYIAISLPAWLTTYVWQDAKHCPYV